MQFWKRAVVTLSDFYLSFLTLKITWIILNVTFDLETIDRDIQVVDECILYLFIVLLVYAVLKFTHSISTCPDP